MNIMSCHTIWVVWKINKLLSRGILNVPFSPSVSSSRVPCRVGSSILQILWSVRGWINTINVMMVYPVMPVMFKRTLFGLFRHFILQFAGLKKKSKTRQYTANCAQIDACINYGKNNFCKYEKNIKIKFVDEINNQFFRNVEHQLGIESLRSSVFNHILSDQHQSSLFRIVITV